MKKILSFTLVLTIILGALCIFPASAEHISEHAINCGEFWYAPLGNNTAAIGLYNLDLTGTIVIPETLDGYTITEIANNGFSEALVSEVIIPNTVTRIGEYTFSYCPNLKNVSIPYGVTTIDYCAFVNCPELTYMFIPDSVTEIGISAIGYEDNYVDNDGVMLPDGGYTEVSRFDIEGYKGSAAERYADENGYHFKFIARDEEYKNEVLNLLNIPEEDPHTGSGWLSYYSELYRYRSDATPCEATPDYVLIEVYENVYGPAFAAELLGDYILRDYNYKYPSTFGYVIYLPKNNEIYSLEKAYELNIEGIENVFTEAGIGELLGDVNYDRELNIKDATLIQKSLVGLEKIKNDYIDGFAFDDIENVPTYISDFNCDRKSDIRDVTAIQKAIAGF